MKPRKLGRFYIDSHLFNENISNLRHLMKEIVVVRAESLFYLDVIEYVAWSESFDELEEGEVIPFYDVQISSNYEVTFARRTS